jgi:Ca2+-binding EF-hand superfamily protein
LFNVFDVDKNEYLDISEFVEGMTTLFTESFEKLIKFVFKFYDFDRDELITYEDVRVVLSYIPLNTQKKINVTKFENADYKDRIESQDELKKILDKCFEKLKKLDFANFQTIVENQHSEICLYILIFILEQKPFTSSTLVPYEGVAKSSNKSPDNNVSRMIASPSLNSKFSPSLTIQKSPSMAKKNLQDVQQNKGGNTVLNKLTGKSPISLGNDEPKSKLLMYAKGGGGVGNSNNVVNLDSKNPVRKQRENLKNIEDLDSKKKIVSKQESGNEEKEDKNNIYPATKYHNQYININKEEEEDDDIKEDIKYEGYLYKLTQTKKLKKLYFKLINRDLYCRFILKFYIILFL